MRQFLNHQNSIAEDLQRCHDLLGLASWKKLAEQRIFITGGTGFVGKWLLASLLDANERLGLNCRVTMLSRNPSAFQQAYPHWAGQVSWVLGDVRDFDFPSGHFDVVIHAATDVAAHSSPVEIFSTCLDGTRHILQFAKHCHAEQFLLISSGAVYGPLPAGMTHVPESHSGGPDVLSSDSAYSEGKRVSEWLACHTSANSLQVKIARIFALVGPYLPLDKHFAIGNFLRAALSNEEIVIDGDGTPHRSYLYAADMAAWLWAVLLRGEPRKAYNIGSEESVSIHQLAERVCKALNVESHIRLKKTHQDQAVQHYVPDTRWTRQVLQLPQSLSLTHAIQRTARWHTN
jgi:nucleoside-diphosphate-sugar epimerase